MKRILKHLASIGILSLMLGLTYSPVYWQQAPLNNDINEKFPYDNAYTRVDINDCRNLWNCTNLWDDVDITDQKSILNRLLEVFGLNSDTFWWEHKFLNYVRAILNMALWLLGFVALVMTIYTFYMIFFTENEAWIKKAKWNLVGIFIALAIIWLSWLIVSFIFRWYQSNWQNALPQSDTTTFSRL